MSPSATIAVAFAFLPVVAFCATSAAYGQTTVQTPALRPGVVAPGRLPPSDPHQGDPPAPHRYPHRPDRHDRQWTPTVYVDADAYLQGATPLPRTTPHASVMKIAPGQDVFETHATGN